MRANFIITEVLNGLRRNVSMTVAMILTTAITLGMLGAGLLVMQMANKSQQIFFNRVEMQIFVNDEIARADPDCAQAPCSTLRDELKNEPGVTNVTWLNLDDAYKAAKEAFKHSPEMADAVTPDTMPASFRVKVNDPDKYGEVIDKFQGRQDLGVDGVQDQRKLVNRLFSVLNGARNAAFVLSLILGVAAVLLIANTVQMAAYTRRTEVSIMRLVGASRWYTQLPFLIEAVIAAVVGTILAVGGLLIGKKFFFDQALNDLYGVNILARVTTTDVLFVSPWLLLAGIVLASATSYVTLRWYVRE
ncbi:cell division protein FtsX [Gordonia araii NBRC 100433]|uniref:Cell division protein FtsX n=1 Tax=Gordonia araii NBRC 100433 TaxID=1073574 RepID=G7H3W4_9ACTN|nr:permease-like cell division protein FtsX [Gordonia araii]NNG99101.1 ABC transporter permease [Gordonia araii NBRC 100433]GAB10539.1 cell division protein FtsX [Gordonia araii NBRC 100433]